MTVTGQCVFLICIWAAFGQQNYTTAAWHDFKATFEFFYFVFFEESKRERERDFLCFRSGQRDGAAACIGIGPWDGLRSIGRRQGVVLVLQDRQLGLGNSPLRTGPTLAEAYCGLPHREVGTTHMQRRGALRSHGSHFQKPLGLSVDERLAQVSLLLEIQSQKQEKLPYSNHP